MHVLIAIGSHYQYLFLAPEINISLCNYNVPDSMVAFASKPTYSLKDVIVSSDISQFCYNLHHLNYLCVKRLLCFVTMCYSVDLQILEMC